MNNLNELKQTANELKAWLKDLTNLFKDQLISSTDYSRLYGRLNTELRVVNWRLNALSRASH